jgi:hypothetical protein
MRRKPNNLIQRTAFKESAADLGVRPKVSAMKKWAPCSLVLIGLLLFVSCQAPSQPVKERDDSPLSKGNFWIYKGKASWTTQGGAVAERISTVRMEVKDVIIRDHLLVAIVKGDLNDYAIDNASDLSDHLIIRVGATTYFNIAGDRISTILDKVKDPKASLFGLLGEDEEQMLDLPLVLGKMYGDPVQLTREDQYYCWVVIKAEEVDLSPIKGLEGYGKKMQYTIRYFTLPGEVLIDFVHGVGITGYRYRHHGTVDEADLKLIEFGKTPNGEKPKTANNPIQPTRNPRG